MISEKYTTAEKISKEESFLKSLDADQLLNYTKNVKSLEKEKTIISNDAMALGELLECLNNRLVK